MDLAIDGGACFPKTDSSTHSLAFVYGEASLGSESLRDTAVY